MLLSVNQPLLTFHFVPPLQTSSASAANQMDSTTLRQLQQLQQLLARQPGGSSDEPTTAAGSSGGGPSSSSTQLANNSSSGPGGPVPYPVHFQKLHDNFDYGGGNEQHTNQMDDAQVVGHGLTDVIPAKAISFVFFLPRNVQNFVVFCCSFLILALFFFWTLHLFNSF